MVRMRFRVTASATLGAGSIPLVLSERLPVTSGITNLQTTQQHGVSILAASCHQQTVRSSVQFR